MADKVTTSNGEVVSICFYVDSRKDTLILPVGKIFPVGSCVGTID